MNPGLAIFKKRQRLQGGTGEVRDKIPPFFENGKWWWERADEQNKLDAKQQAERESVPSTIGIKINGKETEVPLWNEGMTPQEAEEAARMRLEWDLSVFAPDSELERVQNEAHQGPDDVSALIHAGTPDGYAEGDDDVGAPRRPLTEKELRQYEPWIRDMIRSIPLREPDKGPQFRPKPAPFGPDEMLPAQRGTSSVQHFQEGEQTVTDQQMIDRLGYDPGNPYNDLTRGFNSGVPTQRGIGYGANILGNALFPGLGMVTGPGASWLTRMIQNWMGQRNVQNAMSSPSGGDGTTDTNTGSTEDTTGTGDTSGQTSTSGGGLKYGSLPVYDPYGSSFLGGFNPDASAWPGPSSSTNIGNLGTNPIGGGGYFVKSSGPISDSQNFFPVLGGAMPAGSGGGGANMGGAAATQMRQIMKGIYTPMTSGGYAPLSGFAGVQAPSAGTNIAAQQQLHDILMANPGALSGPISGNITRGVPMKQSVQMGSSNITQNPGLRLFMARQGLRKPKPKKPKL